MSNKHPIRSSMLAMGLMAFVMAGSLPALGSSSSLIMFWDQLNPGEGGYLSGFETPDWLEVPDDACGFRLEFPGTDPDAAWSFHYSHGEIVQYQQVKYSSDFLPYLNGPIQAVGPVHACHGQGHYNFQVPLGELSVYGDWPVTNAGAGHFAVEVHSNSALVWLDHAFKPIKTSGGFGKDPKPPKLPPEFIGKSPSVLLCPLDDSLDQYQCLDPSTAASLPGGRAGTMIQAGDTRQAPGPGQRIRATRRQPLPELVMATPSAPSVGQGAVSDTIGCPTSLLVQGTIYRDPDFQPDPVAHAGHEFNPPVAEYRFYFAPEHVASIPMSVELLQEVTEVSHSIPIPLPIPGDDPPTGGIELPTGRMGARMPPDPDHRTPPGRTGIQRSDPHLVGHPVPEGVLQGSVQLQLTNITDSSGNPVTVSSSWSSYKIQCRNGEPPPKDLPVLTTPLPVPPPQPPTGMTTPQAGQTQEMPTCVRGKLEEGRCVCPGGMRAVPTANPNTFQCVPARGRRP